jgi:PAS domain S-box-containing protein
MADKPTYEELEQRVRELEEETNRSKHAEKELMDSEERFRCLTESSPLGVFQTAEDGNVLYLNNKWLTITGMSLQDALGFGWAQALHPEDRPRILAEWTRCLEEKRGYDGEFRFVRPFGEIRWVHTRTSPVFSPAGDIISHVGVNEDITERKQAEEALRESEEKFRHLFEMESDAIFLIRNSDGQIFEVNTAGVKLYEFSREELLKMKNADLSAEPDETRKATLKRKRQVPTRYHKKKDGTVFPVEITGNHFTWRGEEVHIASIRDIAKRKQAEKALRESEERYKSLFKNNHSVMLLIDPESADIVDANPAAISFYGWSHEELTRKKITNINTLTKRQVFQEMKRAKKEQHRIFYFKHRLASGKIRDVEVYSGPIKVYDRELLYSIIHDITKRKQAELALIDRRKELENKTHELEEVNTALNVLLKRREQDKTDLEEKVLANVKELVFPYVEKLNNCRLNDRQMVFLNIIKSNLEEIITPYLHKLSSKYSDLTPSEIQVAGLVKDGKTTKEIAAMLDSSTGAIDFHRNNLRKKLGLRNTKTNLRSFLLSYT